METEHKSLISTTFRETRSKLRKKILGGKIKIKESDKKIRCYFCGKLVDRGYELSEPREDGNGERKFYVDDDCLKRAKTFEYHHETAFSMN